MKLESDSAPPTSDIEVRLQNQAALIERHDPVSASLLRRAAAEIHRNRQHAASAAVIVKSSPRFEDKIALTHLYLIAPK